MDRLHSNTPTGTPPSTPNNQGLSDRGNSPPPIRQQQVIQAEQPAVQQNALPLLPLLNDRRPVRILHPRNNVARNLAADINQILPQLALEAEAPQSPRSVMDKRAFEW
jgi:hypothetical protein